MYRTLFVFAGIAILGWLPLIFAPSWKLTRRLAESALFPAYLAALYVTGLVAVVRASGFGFMADFGSADGVLGLLATEPIALIAWIHILAFDQVVGLLIYRDNMEKRVVPLPVQSVILVATLMLGPVGFLAYWAARVARTRGWPVAWGERAPMPANTPQPVRWSDVASRDDVGGVGLRGMISLAVLMWRRERALVRIAVAGFVLAAANAGVALVNGGWLIGAEGRLLEAIKFDAAFGFYFLTLAAIVPLAGLPERVHTRWIRWTVGCAVFSYFMENVQAWRGLNPRFSEIAGTPDQILGGIFFLQALLLMALFIELMAAFFRHDALPDHAPLRNALRYAAVAAMMAFGVGVIMSFAGGRFSGAGNYMPLHAAGFHGLQALPLVALLAGASAVGRMITHVAGAAWLALCTGLLLQAASGQAPAVATPMLAATVIGAAMWVTAATVAWRAGSVPTAAGIPVSER
jgi:hypothetical protein